MNCQNNNKNQLTEGLEKKFVIWCTLNVINSNFAKNLYVLNETQYNKLKKKPNEKEIFKYLK